MRKVDPTQPQPVPARGGQLDQKLRRRARDPGDGQPPDANPGSQQQRAGDDRAVEQQRGQSGCREILVGLQESCDENGEREKQHRGEDDPGQPHRQFRQPRRCGEARCGEWNQERRRRQAGHHHRRPRQEHETEETSGDAPGLVQFAAGEVAADRRDEDDTEGAAQQQPLDEERQIVRDDIGGLSVRGPEQPRRGHFAQ